MSLSVEQATAQLSASHIASARTGRRHVETLLLASESEGFVTWVQRPSISREISELIERDTDPLG